MNTTIYGAQQCANIMQFRFGSEHRAKYECMKLLVNVFSERKIRWGLSCSAGLYFHGIFDTFNDYDIVIHTDDINLALEILRDLVQRGIMTEERAYSKPCFKSDYYGEFKFVSTDGIVEMDIVGGEFGVNTFGAHYGYNFDSQYADYVAIDESITVPLIPEEGQWLLYSMMIGWQPHRVFKRNLITNYLKATGIKHPEVFKEALEYPNNLPYIIKADLNELYPVKQ